MAVVTRFAALKYVEGTTAEQKRAILENMLKLYDNEYVVEGSGFQGGKNNNPEGFDKGFDIVFTVKFKSLEARDKFTEDSRNIAFKTQNGAMFADAVVYDFEDGMWGY